MSKIFEEFSENGIAIWNHGNMEEIEKARNVILSYNHTRIRDLIGLDKVFSEMLYELKPILDEVFVDEEYHLTTYSSNTLRKNGKEKASLHVDYPYHDLPEPYPDALLGIQVIYALDDFTVQNGATIYIPESYKTHRYPYFCDLLNNAQYLLVKKGSIIMYRGDLWHKAGINITDNPRVAILANFSPLYIDAKDDMVDQISKIKFPTLNIDDDKVVF